MFIYIMQFLSKHYAYARQARTPQSFLNPDGEEEGDSLICG